jgi:pimeloyl-ACP methyl ester carboxylesterase
MCIDIDGLKIAYKISGCEDENAPVAVILQGWGTSYALYNIVADAILDKYKVVQFDLPGFGESTEPERSWSVSDYTEFFVKFLNALGITSCMLIGHSYGGRIIIKLAGGSEDCPVDITQIVLIDSAGVLPIRTFKQKCRQRSYKILKAVFNNKLIYWLFDEIIDDWKNRQGSEDYRNATPVMRGTLVKAVNEDLTEYLPKIKAKALLIWGDLDTATPMRDAHIMEEKIPDAVLKVIPGTGHFSYAENPGMFTDIIRDYLGI